MLWSQKSVQYTFMCKCVSIWNICTILYWLLKHKFDSHELELATGTHIVQGVVIWRKESWKDKKEDQYCSFMMTHPHLCHLSSKSHRRCSTQWQRIHRRQRRRVQTTEQRVPSFELCGCRGQTGRRWALPGLHKGGPWTLFGSRGRTIARRLRRLCRGEWGSRWRRSESFWWSASSPPSGSWSGSPQPSWES